MKYKKYKEFSEIHKHQEVKLNTSDCWNGLFGVIENVEPIHKMAVVFCIEKPDLRYLVFPWNLESIEMVKY